MTKVKLHKIANIYNGYSNKLQKGKVRASILGIKEIRYNKPIEGIYALREDTIKKLQIHVNSILISNIQNSKVFEYGKNYCGSLVGKGLYKIDIINKDVPIEYLMAILKSDVKHLPYEGSIIKLLRINDLENMVIPIPSKKVMKLVVRLEKYKDELFKQEELISLYIKSIIKEIYGKNN